MHRYYSNGKLLLSGEYLVLDGALSLALPTKFGQDLQVFPIEENKIVWESYSDENKLWFSTEINLNELAVSSEDKFVATLKKILLEAQKMNPEFLDTEKGFLVYTHLSFPTNWGLGTSSTLINNIASWANVDAFELLNKSFGGSGYDIACAQNNTAIQYQIKEEGPKVSKVSFQPSFSENLFFVYLNQKQDSKEGIQMYKSLKIDKVVLSKKISEITEKMTTATTLQIFEELIFEHEKLMGDLLKIQPVKERLFADYFGAIKSLGAWGGDFVLVTGNEQTPVYFKEKGYHTILSYNDMILS